MPCSRSARSPSVSSARLVYSSPRAELVLEDGLRVEQQPPDEGALAVIHRACGREPQDVGLMTGPGTHHGFGVLARHQKYPSRLRSSMAASLVRSSARVWPRSVMRVAAISAMTSATVVAVDSTAPVQDMSPTVRYLTLVSNTGSSSPLVM